MTINGILDIYMVQSGTVTGDIFYEFIHRKISPHLMPFNGNNPNSVVVMDYCSVHNDGVLIIQEMGSIAHFLPPYSPDYTPIELLFSKLKILISTMEKDMGAIDDIQTIVLSALTYITAEDCKKWIYNIGL
jgi:hypothetical protein